MRIADSSPRRLLLSIAVISVLPFVAVRLLTLHRQCLFDVPSYLLFHNLAECFSIMVSLSIFGLTWHAYDQNRDRHLLYLGVTFLVVGLIDFMHTLGYTGMPPLVTVNTPNKATQFWIAARLFGASGFLLSSFVTPRSKSPLLSKGALLTSGLGIATAVFVGVIYFPQSVPATFVQGAGLTPFKITSEYLVIGLLLLTLARYSRRMERSNDGLALYCVAAFMLCILSELAFTGYTSVFDAYNVLGHLYKVMAFGLIYRAVFIGSIKRAYGELLVSSEELRQSRNMLSHIINSIPQSIFWKDTDSVYRGCNRAFATQAGIPEPADIVGKSDYDLPWSPEETEGYRADDREVIQSRRPKVHIIERQHDSRGQDAWLDTTKIPFTDASDAIIGVLGVYDDITGQKRREEELRESLLFNQQIINCAQEGIIVYDRDLVCRVWNPFMENLTGVPAAQVVGRAPADMFPFLKDGGVTERLSLILGGEATDAVEFPFQMVSTGKSGWACDTSAPLLNADGEIIGVIGTVRDTTENRKAEDQLRQSQKMESLGVLAGGIAHDFNNVLSVIMGFSYLLQEKLTGEDGDYLEEILAAAQRAADLTSGLLSYSRKQIFRMEPVILGDLVLAVQKFLRQVIGEDVMLAIQLPDRPMLANIDKTHIQQVLLNLAANARDAMPAGGTLSIRIKRVEIDREFIRVHGYGKVGTYALLVVSDTGCGIPKQHLRDVFEPFFTTKEVGKGTGLGLSVVYGIVSQHKGFINCYSEQGLGTTFNIYLPLAEGEPEPRTETARFDASTGSGVTVLMAEDDASVRTITKNVLEKFGFKVLSARDGEEAVELFARHIDEVDLVLLDALMPGMNGAETLSELRKLAPDVKAVFVSGYPREIISGKMLIPEGIGFVSKPVLPATLIAAILGEARGDAGLSAR